MLIKIKNADYSDNNLGSIDIEPIIDNDIEVMLDNYTKTLTNHQKAAIQLYVSSLRLSGIWDSIGNLYLPVLSGDISEAMYNLKTGAVDVSPSDRFELSTNGGITPIADEILGSGDRLSVPTTGLSTKNVHVLMYGVEKLDDWVYADNNDTRLIGYAGSAQLRAYYEESSVDKNVGLLFSPSLTGVISQSLSVLPSFQGFSSRSDNKASLSNGGVISKADAQVDDVAYGNVSMPLLQRYNGDTGSNRLSAGIISLGTSLADDDLVLYQTLSDNLMSYFL